MRSDFSLPSLCIVIRQLICQVRFCVLYTIFFRANKRRSNSRVSSRSEALQTALGVTILQFLLSFPGYLSFCVHC